MPTVEANGITMNYTIDGDPSPKKDLLVLINGLADDLETWSTQVPAFVSAGYLILRYDNRGIGKTSAPPGPYTSELLADDLHALLDHPDLSHLPKRFHLLGVSMGGLIAQSYALKYPNGATNPRTILTLSLCCTWAEPATFLTRLFDLWADMARRMSVRDVMRDVTMWAFTVPFFRQRQNELEEVEEAMRNLDMPLGAYLAQLAVIRTFDSTASLGDLVAGGKVLGNVGREGDGERHRRVMVLAGRTDILIPVILSRELSERVEGSRFVTVKGGHACMWEFPDDFNKTVIQFLDEYKENR